MPPEPFQALHGIQGTKASVGHLPGSDISKIPGAKVRQQRKPHIGGGSAVSHPLHREFLVVIRRQPLIGLSNEFFEKRPGLPCQLPKKKLLLVVYFALRYPQQTTELPGGGRRS